VRGGTDRYVEGGTGGQGGCDEGSTAGAMHCRQQATSVLQRRTRKVAPSEGKREGLRSHLPNDIAWLGPSAPGLPLLLLPPSPTPPPAHTLTFLVMQNMPGMAEMSCPARSVEAALRAVRAGDHSRSQSLVRCHPRGPGQGAALG
jgi:hypothetical protein